MVYVFLNPVDIAHCHAAPLTFMLHFPTLACILRHSLHKTHNSVNTCRFTGCRHGIVLVEVGSILSTATFVSYVHATSTFKLQSQTFCTLPNICLSVYRSHVFMCNKLVWFKEEFGRICINLKSVSKLFPVWVWVFVCIVSSQSKCFEHICA